VRRKPPAKAKKLPAKRPPAKAKKPAPKAKQPAPPRSPLSPRDAKRLAQLQAAGLFTDLDAKLIAKLVAGGGVASDDMPDALAAILDRYASLPRVSPRVVRAIQDVPAGLKLERVLTAVDARHVKLLVGPKAGLYAPRTYHEWAALISAALAAAGDPRAYVALKVLDWEEPVFVLADRAQERVLASTKVEEVYAERGLPPKVQIDKRLTEVARRLSSQLPPNIGVARVAGDEIEVELAANGAAALVEALYRAKRQGDRRMARIRNEQP
jgi:hypothetical protein